jgi:hypothetical protein
MLLVTGETRSNFADLDVPIWAWFALVGVIGVMLAVDLFRHRDPLLQTGGCIRAPRRSAKR